VVPPAAWAVAEAAWNAAKSNSSSIPVQDVSQGNWRGCSGNENRPPFVATSGLYVYVWALSGGMTGSSAAIAFEALRNI
jgi:hypothetical protein